MPQILAAELDPHIFTVLLHKLDNCITSLLAYLTHFQFTVAIAKQVTSELTLLADSVSSWRDDVLQTLCLLRMVCYKTRFIYKIRFETFFSSHLPSLLANVRIFAYTL